MRTPQGLIEIPKPIPLPQPTPLPQPAPMPVPQMTLQASVLPPYGAGAAAMAASGQEFQLGPVNLAVSSQLAGVAGQPATAGQPAVVTPGQPAAVPGQNPSLAAGATAIPGQAGTIISSQARSPWQAGTELEAQAASLALAEVTALKRNLTQVAPITTVASNQIPLPPPEVFWGTTSAMQRVSIPTPEDYWGSTPVQSQIILQNPEDFWRR